MANAVLETTPGLGFQQTRFFLANRKVDNPNQVLSDAIYKHYEMTRAKNELSHNREETPDKKLELALTFAQNYLNFLRLAMGLPEIPSDQLKMVLQNDENYSLIYENVLFDPGETTPGEADNVGGNYQFPMEHVMVKRSDRFPDYIAASFGLHELIHFAIDQVVATYEVLPDGHTRFFQQRSGLVVARKVKDMLTGEQKREEGAHLLNELGNYFWQVQFIKDLFHDEKGAELYQAEISEREEMLYETLFAEDDLVIRVRLDSFPSYYMSKENVFFGDNGKYFAAATPFIICQLVEDLSLLVHTIEGETFPVALLKAKREPRLQNALRKAVNGAMGAGFFERLKRASVNPTDIISLLVEVQSRLPDLYP